MPATMTAEHSAMIAYPDKMTARSAVWRALDDQGQAAYPFPPRGRIPNFKGAELAARRLLDHPWFASVKHLKANPDAPQLPVRVGALRRGITVYVPTPRLKGGFRRLDPAKIPEGDYRKAASLTHMDDYAESVGLRDLPAFDLIVTGSVAVTRAGKRCGKGHGYGDLEFAILRELGHPPPRVATTVHDLQLVEDFPSERHDLPVSLIVTPDATIEVAASLPPPLGIDWSLLKPEDLAAMPILADLKAIKQPRPVVSTDGSPDCAT